MSALVGNAGTQSEAVTLPIGADIPAPSEAIGSGVGRAYASP